jgi:hypothetical protein
LGTGLRKAFSALARLQHISVLYVAIAGLSSSRTATNVFRLAILEAMKVLVLGFSRLEDSYEFDRGQQLWRDKHIFIERLSGKRFSTHLSR